jgi:hypothetical protein
MKIVALNSRCRLALTWSRAVIRLAVIILFAIGCATAIAQEAVDSGVRWRNLTGYAEVVLVDKYIYHGYVTEDRGPIVQPYFEIYEEFYRGTGLLTSASGKFSLFNSLQPRHDEMNNTSAPGHWFYELQVEAGLELQFARQFTISLGYLRFESPIDAYRPSNALQLTLKWDDKDVPGWFPLSPHVTWLASLPFGWNANKGDGNYFEIGISPATIIGNEGQYPLTLTVPANIGVGDDRYYPGDNFGFASIGLSASVPLAFLPKDLGTWKFAVSGTYYYLGRAPADLTNDGERHQSVFGATLSTEF